MQRAPVGLGQCPALTDRGVGPAPQELQGFGIGRDDAGEGGKLHRHVTQGHARFHVEAGHRSAGKLHRVTAAAMGAVAGDQVQDHILGGHALRQFALETHSHGLRAPHPQGLGGQGVLRLAAADTPGQGAHGTLGAGVAVGADQAHPRLHDALLRRHHVHDALPGVVQVEQGDAGAVGVVAGGDNKIPAAGHGGVVAAIGKGIDDVVHAAEYLLRAEHLAPLGPQAGQGNGTGALMQEYTVDVDQVATVLLAFHQVLIPQLVEQGQRHNHL